LTSGGGADPMVMPIFFPEEEFGILFVEVAPKDFMALLTRTNKPLVIVTASGIRRKGYKYLMKYRGFFFFTRSDIPLEIPPGVEVVVAERIWESLPP